MAALRWFPDSAFSLSFEEDARLAQFASPLSLYVLPFRGIVLSFVTQTGEQSREGSVRAVTCPRTSTWGKPRAAEMVSHGELENKVFDIGHVYANIKG